MDITKEIFGETDQQSVYAFTMKNDHGMEITCLNYGCIITKILAPDSEGRLENVVLGFDSLEEYRNHSPYFGAVVGRVAGRIKGGSFIIEGRNYVLPKNENGNHLHGGFKGFNNVIWEAKVLEKENEGSVQFTYLSPDGEEGYPGNVQISVTYTLTNTNELVISYKGKSDQKTLLNLTNHTYFNLSGNLRRKITDHSLKIKSDSILELNEQLLPTGEIKSVEGTPFNFQHARIVRDGIESDHPQILLAGNGYDHPFLLNTNHDKEIVLWDEESGRSLTIETDEPGVVLYTGNQLDGHFKIRGVLSNPHLGLCLETQGLPDAIHHPHFPSIILDKDEQYSSVTTYQFGTL
ncbi:aldose epimerase family protein [Metabacillus arenae]|uniref:Aldose 1-epimerase n=1 Tax=Metabacillus arenae TaxID=2771434 RepID=A0A926NER3_9BACI|nr:aldose epimerase family protein [Metabacillus arenae]MBD1382882.1 galactose mutarotase [Metabacillus arenae]